MSESAKEEEEVEGGNKSRKVGREEGKGRKEGRKENRERLGEAKK